MESATKTKTTTAMLPNSIGSATKYPSNTASGRDNPMIKWVLGMLIVFAISHQKQTKTRASPQPFSSQKPLLKRILVIA